MTEQMTGFDFEAMRRAVEQLDADLLLYLYADDAEMKIVNKSATPSSPVRSGARRRLGSIYATSAGGR